VQTKTYRVEGLSCIDCADQIQATVGQLESVEACQVDYATGRLTLQLNVPDFDDAPVAKIVQETGHRLRADGHQPQDNQPLLAFARFLFSERDTVLTAISGALTILGLLLLVLRMPTPWRVLPFALAVLVGGYPVARHALNEIVRAHSLGINALMVIAVTGAVFIGQWAEAAVVVVLFALGEALEGYTTERARGALESLLDLAPPTALLLQADGTTEEVPIEQLAVGDRVRVRPGDRVSVDGVVRAGRSGVDQAAITGESIPVDKAPGDEVFAGTINTSGVLEVEVTRLAADNTLSRMIDLVQKAQSEKAPVQRFVERFAHVYTPAVAIFALLVAALPPLLFAQPFLGERGWLVRALQMLVIACPCALVISTPVTVVSALTNAARRGVLIKGRADSRSAEPGDSLCLRQDRHTHRGPPCNHRRAQRLPRLFLRPQRPAIRGGSRGTLVAPAGARAGGGGSGTGCIRACGRASQHPQWTRCDRAGQRQADHSGQPFVL